MANVSYLNSMFKDPFLFSALANRDPYLSEAIHGLFKLRHYLMKHDGLDGFHATIAGFEIKAL